MVNKKGQEMSVTTLILIVIGIVLLVVLILGFSMGWSNLWSKINIIGGGTGIDTVIQGCNIAATSDAAFSYCNEFKEVTLPGSVKTFINCHYSAVEEKLTKKLSCTGDPIEVYCTDLANAATSSSALAAVKNTHVNDKTCGSYTFPCSKNLV